MIIAATASRTQRFHPLLWTGAAALLTLPAAAMQVTQEVNWGVGDFAVFALMLTVFCLAIEAAWHWLDSRLTRLAAALVAVLAFLAVWVELAVGIFD